MNKQRLLLVLSLLLISGAMLLLSGCNTWRGLGQDIEGTGDSMQDK